jgi:hypothetical protein
MATLQYTPPPTVRDFIKHHKPGELFFDWIVGPVGSGKTTGIFFKLAYMASLQEKSPLDGIRRSRAVIVRNTMPQLKDTTIKSWDYWFKDGQAGKWLATVNTFVLKFGDVECEVMFRPLDTPDDVQRVLSLEVTFAILDEFVQIPQEIQEALSARCGRYPPKKDGGATNWGMWGASNPGNEDDWWANYLERPEELTEKGVDLSTWTYFKQPSGFSPMAENLANLPGGDLYYTNLAKGKATHWVKQFIEVEWGYSLSGKPVVTTFNPAYHMSPKPLVFNPNWPLYAGFDPGMHSAFIFGQLTMEARLNVLGELVSEGYGAERLISERLNPFLRNRFPHLREFILCPDPASKQRAQTDERSVMQVFKEAKFVVDYVDDNNRLIKRIEGIDHFATRLVPGGAALQIDPSCIKLKRAITSGWRYRVNKDRNTSVEPENNEYTHPGDAFGYLCRYTASKDARFANGSAQGAFVAPSFNNSYVMR